MRYAILVMLIVISGCGKPSSYSHEVKEVWLHGKCDTMWGGILQDWVDQNGQIDGGFSEIKAAISIDNKTLFSKMVRQVWSKQKKHRKYDNRTIWKYFDEVINRQVSSECTNPIFLISKLYPGNSPGLYTEKGIEDIESGMPDEFKNHSSHYQNWIFYNILRAPAEVDKNTQK